IEENSLSFLRVTRPEGEYPEGNVPSGPAVFDRARQNLEQFIRDGVLSLDTEPAVYVYQLDTGDHTQTGVVACCSIADYDADKIKKHEKTRPDKVADRTGHMLAVGAQTGLIFLAFRNTDNIRALIADTLADEPIYNFVCPAGVAQKIWRRLDTDAWVDAFAELPEIYVADGHHRVESAKLARDKMRAANPDHTGEEEYNFVVAGIFPSDDLKILPYNRVVKDLNGLTNEDFLARIGENFVVTETSDDTPKNRGEICMYLDEKWFNLRSNIEYVSQPDAIESLDVSILQNYLLAPILNVGDPRTDTRIAFVGGARGTAELKKMVDADEGKAAFSMYPTTMDDLFAVSDIGEIMPPKSTWFEPKLKDGLLVHQI
ncbi:MAG: DUF1015 family protein, partial [Pyrinomonadaceae bacterium]